MQLHLINPKGQQSAVCIWQLALEESDVAAAIDTFRRLTEADNGMLMGGFANKVICGSIHVDGLFQYLHVRIALEDIQPL